MATYKGVGVDGVTGRLRTGTNSDDISFASQVTATDGISVTGDATVTGDVQSATLTITGNASVAGDLTVSGDIVSRGSQNLVVQDNFIDLNAGNTSTTALSSGFTFSLNRNSSFTASTVTTFVAGVASTSNPTFTNTDAGSSSLLAAGDIVFITGANLADNDGLFVVEAVNQASFPQTVTIKGIGTSAVSGSTPFAQNQFTADTGDSATAFKVDLKVLAVADGTANFNDSGGSAIAKGSLIEAYAAAATESDFTANGDYTEIGSGAVSLQTAYDNGQTITVSASNLAIDDTTNGTNDFTIGGGTYFATFSVDSADLSLTGRTTSGALTLSSEGTAGGDLAILHAGSGSSSIVFGYGVNTQMSIDASNINLTDDVVMNKASGGGQQITKDGSALAGDDLILTVTGNQNSSLALISEGTGTDALKFNTTTNGGGIEIDSVGVLSMSSDDTTSLTMDANNAGNKTLTIQANNAGAGEGNIVVDADNNINLQIAGTNVAVLTSSGLTLAAGATVNDINDENDMTSDSATALATQQSIKAYVDNRGISNFATTVSMVANETIAFGDVVAIKVTGGNEGRAILADADSIDTCNIIGICIVGGSITQTIKVIQTGTIGGYSGLTVGSKQFASTTAGALTETAPNGAGDVVFQVGFAITSTQIVVQPVFSMIIG